MSENDNNGSGCFGCITFIVCVILLWAILFGITVNGKHYGLSCSFKDGVEIR